MVHRVLLIDMCLVLDLCVGMVQHTVGVLYLLEIIAFFDSKCVLFFCVESPGARRCGRLGSEGTYVGPYLPNNPRKPR